MHHNEQIPKRLSLVKQLSHQRYNSYATPKSIIIKFSTSPNGNEHFQTFFVGIPVGLVKRTKRKIQQCRYWAIKTQQSTHLYSTRSQGYIKTMKILFSFSKLCWHFDQSRGYLLVKALCGFRDSKNVEVNPTCLERTTFCSNLRKYISLNCLWPVRLSCVNSESPPSEVL